MIVVGVDPGLNGAVAVWDGKTLTAFEVPSVKAKSRGREMDVSNFVNNFDILCDGADHAFIELVHAMPRQGTASMFKFGYTAGVMRGVISARRIPVTMVTSSVWKKAVGVAAEKDASRARASELFPGFSHLFSRKKDDGVAEASLIAWYGRNKLNGSA